jgi:hypothetical protein
VKILALAHPLKEVNPAELFPTIVAETRRAWELIQENILREVYFRQGSRLTVVMLECASVDEAQTALDTLPLVKAGVINFELIPLAPFDSLEILFPPPG